METFVHTNHLYLISKAADPVHMLHELPMSVPLGTVEINTMKWVTGSILMHEWGRQVLSHTIFYPFEVWCSHRLDVMMVNTSQCIWLKSVTAVRGWPFEFSLCCTLSQLNNSLYVLVVAAIFKLALYDFRLPVISIFNIRRLWIAGYSLKPSQQHFRLT